MDLPPAFWNNLLLALGLGLGVGILLWLFRGSTTVSRVRVSAALAAVAGGVYLVLTGLGLSGESLQIKATISIGLLLAANTLLQLFDLVLWDYLFARRRHVAVPRLLVDLFNFVVLAAVALGLLSGVFGVDLNTLLVTSTVASAVIGLALQDMLSNIIAGVALQLERPFAVGDWVTVNGQEGEVMQMSWRTLTLRTRDHHNIFIPNGSAAREDILNYSRPTPLQRLHVDVGLGYSHPPGQVQEVIVRAVRAAPGVLNEPAPEALLLSFGDFSVQYDVRFWITDFAHAPMIQGEVRKRIWYALRREGLAIPFPVRDVNVRMLSDEDKIRAALQLRDEVYSVLRPLALFEQMSDEQVYQLVQGATLDRYAHGEALVQQGQAGDSLYVIRTGRVRVDVRSESGQVATVARLEPNDFFGEMSLLTGEPRTASVVAEAETEVVVVDKPDLAPVIRGDSAVLEALTTVLEERLRNAAERAALEASASASTRRDPQHGVLLNRIRRFFGI